MWFDYNNGNYKILFNSENGTKIRFNDKDDFLPDRPEFLNVKITNKCNHNCFYCQEGSHPEGFEATDESLDHFLDIVPPRTEITCSGGNIMLNWKKTEYFLKGLIVNDCFPSIIISQKDFIEYIDIIYDWVSDNLIYGIGISLTNPGDEELFVCADLIKEVKDIIIFYAIVGIFSKRDFDALRYRNIKILFVGFKTRGRGLNAFNQQSEIISLNTKWLSQNILSIKPCFDVVAFDNLALTQLKIKSKISKEDWNRFYLGEDGQYSFYIDLIKNGFAKSSNSYFKSAMLDYSIEEMFKQVRKEKDRLA